ncbi:hypothetical protein PV10_05015 [Exophiala mesophila]|uniref:CFEM domain-containing protein n=1 Tax=Exophiala mesophila TaxID=212818 RepID=A0A0D1ZIR6_EXOME|nr:uncharacterized protein PV10_05015 [Exophiala mesophila]KIV93829.1 hypothetical protein PV10_05015 [Exophiala mesophila]
MKGLFASAVLLAATAQAGLVPVSSAVCLTNAIVATECSATDNTCICTSDVFLTELAECAETTAADEEQAEQMVTIADAFCGSSGADVKGDLRKRWGGQWTNWGNGKPWGGRRPGGKPWGGRRPPFGFRPPWAKPGTPAPAPAPAPEPAKDTPSPPSSPSRPPWARPGWGRPNKPPGWATWTKPSPVNPPPPVNTVW